MDVTDIENELNKTMKVKRNENIFVSVRSPDKIKNKIKNKTNKNYLKPTTSSINKTCQKFNNKPYSNRTNLSNTTTISSRREKINTSNQNRPLSRSLNCIVYYDKLDHFGDNNNLSYDTYGHFS